MKLLTQTWMSALERIRYAIMVDYAITKRDPTYVLVPAAGQELTVTQVLHTYK